MREEVDGVSVLPTSPRPRRSLEAVRAGLAGAGGRVVGETRGAGGESVAQTGAGGAGPESARAVQTAPPGPLVHTLALTTLPAPHVALLLGLALLLQVLGAPALTLHLVLHLETGALLVALPPRHRTLAHHHGHPPHPGGDRDAGARPVTSSTTSPHHHVTRAQLVDIRVVRPRHGDHLEIVMIDTLFVFGLLVQTCRYIVAE